MLFVISDGYFDFEEGNRFKKEGNRYTSSVFIKNLREKSDWKKEMEEKDYGLIPVNKYFNHLKVCVLEVNPKNDNLNETDILKYMWSKWLEEMKIIDFEVNRKSSLPKTSNFISSFIISSKNLIQ